MKTILVSKDLFRFIKRGHTPILNWVGGPAVTTHTFGSNFVPPGFVLFVSDGSKKKKIKK